MTRTRLWLIGCRMEFGHRATPSRRHGSCAPMWHLLQIVIVVTIDYDIMITAVEQADELLWDDLL